MHVHYILLRSLGSGWVRGRSGAVGAAPEREESEVAIEDATIEVIEEKLNEEASYSFSVFF